MLCGEGNGTPLQHSCLENPVDGGAWWAAVHGAVKSRNRLSDFTFPFHFHALGKEMAIHSSVLAWRIPGTAEPGGLPSMGSHRVGHDWSDLAAVAAGYALRKMAFLQKTNKGGLYSCPANRFICTIFFFFWIPRICVNIRICFLFLTYFTLYDRL